MFFKRFSYKICFETFSFDFSWVQYGRFLNVGREGEDFSSRGSMAQNLIAWLIKKCLFMAVAQPGGRNWSTLLARVIIMSHGILFRKLVLIIGFRSSKTAQNI